MLHARLSESSGATLEQRETEIFSEAYLLRRPLLEALTQDLIDRTVWPTEGVLRDASWTVEDVDAVLLVGGQTRMPRLRAQIGELFGRAVHEVADPETLVAVGAARQGAARFGPKRKARWSGPVTESSCLSLGIENAGGVFLRLIPRGTPLPAERRQVFSTSVDGQTQIVVHLLQGEREMAADNESVLKIQIAGLTPRPRGEAQIEVTLVSTGAGLPTVTARDLATAEDRVVRVRPSGGMTEAELAALSAAHASGALGAEVLASQDLVTEDAGPDMGGGGGDGAGGDDDGTGGTGGGGGPDIDAGGDADVDARVDASAERDGQTFPVPPVSTG